MSANAPFRPSDAFAELFVAPLGGTKKERDGAVGAPFCDPVEPAPFPQSIVRFRNDRWAARIGLDDLDDAGWIARFARFEPFEGSLPQPLALRYHGHQFRSYNPDIGDGRGFLYAQCYDAAGRLLDLGTKGSGRTPYSRFGDGRLTLKGGVREALATETLEALGVYTSKTLSLIETGEALDRQDEPSPTRSCVMVRLGHSHVRFGAFQRLAAEEDGDAIAALVDYAVRHFYPDLADLDLGPRAAAFFERVAWRTARLVSQWMAAGFVHGVLNTDNMNVTGESFDYGPWRFLPTLDPGFTAAYFDHTGLYAYARQAEAAAWNLSRLGGALTDLASEDALNAALQQFGAVYEREMTVAFYRRLGLAPSGDTPYSVIGDLLVWMQESQVPFEQVFFDWFCGAASADRRARSPLAAQYERDTFAPIARALSGFDPVRPERLAHPYFAREAPHTMLIDAVEASWAPIADADEWGPFDAAVAAAREAGAAYAFDASRFDAAPPSAAT
ncbi:MAG: YdiU family protein [Pseudomonadota bacterium]